MGAILGAVSNAAAMPSADFVDFFGKILIKLSKYIGINKLRSGPCSAHDIYKRIVCGRTVLTFKFVVLCDVLTPNKRQAIA